MSGTYWSDRIPVHGPPATGRYHRNGSFLRRNEATPRLPTRDEATPPFLLRNEVTPRYPCGTRRRLVFSRRMRQRLLPRAGQGDASLSRAGGMTSSPRAEL
ncbi:hypothetical protein B296_00031954, partial [Ensete ventricosum]